MILQYTVIIRIEWHLNFRLIKTAPVHLVRVYSYRYYYVTEKLCLNSVISLYTALPLNWFSRSLAAITYISFLGILAF